MRAAGRRRPRPEVTARPERHTLDEHIRCFDSRIVRFESRSVARTTCSGPPAKPSGSGSIAGWSSRRRVDGLDPPQAAAAAPMPGPTGAQRRRPRPASGDRRIRPGRDPTRRRPATPSGDRLGRFRGHFGTKPTTPPETAARLAAAASPISSGNGSGVDGIRSASALDLGRDIRPAHPSLA